MVIEDFGQGIVLLTVGFFLIQGMWLSALTYLVYRKAQGGSQGQDSMREPGDSYIEDIFLLHRSGRLIKHLTRRIKPQVDSDIMSGMLRIVQEFVRDAFREGEGEEEGDLNELAFGELKISICSGNHIALATIIRGRKPEEILEQMKAAVQDIEELRGERLRSWDGRMSRVRFVDEFLQKLLEGGYHSGATGELSPPALGERTPPSGRAPRRT